MPTATRWVKDEQLIHEFVGSAHVFSSAVKEVVEKRLLKEAVGVTLTHPQFKLLKMVSLTNAQTINDVAIFLGVSTAAASKSVEKLVRRKLLRRDEGSPDRRTVRLSLTDASRQHLASYDQRRHAKLAKIFHRFSAADLHHTAKLLDQLSAELVDHTADPDEICLQCGIYFRERCVVRQLTKRTCFYLGRGAAARRRKESNGVPKDAVKRRRS